MIQKLCGKICRHLAREEEKVSTDSDAMCYHWSLWQILLWLRLQANILLNMIVNSWDKWIKGEGELYDHWPVTIARVLSII